MKRTTCVNCGKKITLRYDPVSEGNPACSRCAGDVSRARGRAHAAMDALWRSGFMSRTQAYKWLQKRLQMTEDEAHISKFNVAQCERVVELVRVSLGSLAATMLAEDLLK